MDSPVRVQSTPTCAAPDSVPTVARALLNKLVNWKVFTRAATGTCAFGGLSEDTDGEGKRSRVSALEPVDSFLIRAIHPDGRAFVAVWVHRHGSLTKTGKPTWSVDSVWRGRRQDEFTPKRITATELKAYVAWPPADEGAA